LNSIEHYFRRKSDYKFWTGDIFCENENNKSYCIVLTPRCNIGHSNYDEILLCKISNIEESHIQEFTSTKIADKNTGETKGVKSFRTSITDDVTNNRIGERYRFLPPTPQFSGGFIDYKTMFTQDSVAFLDNYERVISLSDELTNDIIRKFSAYILRGGISETAFDEAHFYLTKMINLKKK